MYTPILFPETAALESIIEVIHSRLSPSAIYGLGSHKQSVSWSRALGETVEQSHNHLYLLVLARSIPPNAAADLASLISDNSKGKVTATIMLHNVTALHAPVMRYFFYTVMRSGSLIYGNEWDAPYLVLDKEPTPNCESNLRYWKRREALATSLLESAAATNNPETVAVRAMLLHFAVEHICLGLLRVLLEYRPDTFTLSYLFDLCRYCTPLIDEIFPRRTREDKALFRLLATSPTHLRTKPPEYPSHAIEVLQRHCEEFLAEARSLIKDKSFFFS